MKELFRTNDPVLLSWADALLRSEGIEALVLDGHASVVDGSIGAIPRRLVVEDEEHPRAQRLIDAARAALPR